jgi:peptidoglycan-associated lipoprotein
MRTLTVRIVVIACAGAALTAAALSPAPHSIYFDFDSSNVKDENRAVLDSWAKLLIDNRRFTMRIEGNTDEHGSAQYNVALGQRRAQAVLRELEGRGVAENQLTIVSYGKQKPVALGHDSMSWAQNRRVDLVDLEVR